MTSQVVSIEAAGMACPVGLTWQSACAALRAGVNRKTSSCYRDNQGREIIASFLHEPIPTDAAWQDRWLMLLTLAIRDALGTRTLAAMPIFVALPVSGHGAAFDSAWVAQSLSNRLGLPLAASQVHVFSEGSAGGYAALQQGCLQVRRGTTCVVAAADSLLSAQRLLPLSEQDRLLVEGNSDGFVPGEAAAAVLLGDDPRRALAHIRGLGFAREPSRIDNEIPLRADGMLAASQAALAEAALLPHDLDFRISDATGESFYFKEQSLLVTRLLRERKPEFPLWLPAESLGDTGAAAGLCGLIWATAAWQRGYAPGPCALACAGNEQGARAAVVLQNPRPGQTRHSVWR